MRKVILGLLVFVSYCCINAQSFEMDQVEQIWRPRIKADFRYVGNTKFSDTTRNFSSTDQNCVITFPIKTKFSADLKLDLTSLNTKNIFKNSVRIKASQVMGSVKFGAKQIRTVIDNNSNHNLYYASAGVFGLKLTKKYRVLFYSLNAGFNEQDKTLNTMALRANSVIGQFHIRGLRKNYYYGIAATYGDARFFPVPFFGGMQPIGEHWTFNYTLPAQMYVQFRINNKNSLSSGVTLDGYRYGMQFKNERINFSYGTLSAFANYRLKVNKSFGFRLNGGYNFVQKLNLELDRNTRLTGTMNPGFYVEAGFYTLFGQNLFEQITGSINNNVFN